MQIRVIRVIHVLFFFIVQEHIQTSPIHPGWIIPVTMVAGLVASGPLAGATLARCGSRKWGWLVGIGVGLIGLALLGVMLLWQVEWYWTTLTLLITHLIGGVLLFFLLRSPYQRCRAAQPLPARSRGTYREIIAGIVGGAFLGGLLGMAGMALYVLLSDWLFSTIMPVAAEDQLALIRVFTGALFMTLAGAIAGGSIGWAQRRLTPVDVIRYAAGFAWCYCTWFLALDVAIAIPIFQAGAATGGGWDEIMLAFLPGNLLLGVWWIVWLLAFLMTPARMVGQLGRAMPVAGLNLAAAVTLSIAFGYPADMFLAAGRSLERRAFTAQAVWCYERGLRKEPQAAVASYLQYRVALLHHKLGETAKAVQGFKRVVARYNQNEELTKQASRFLENLERATAPKRVVLPGVETRTEYKGGYCVPNSLALAMRYWGADVTARSIGKRITGLGRGTFEVNQRWFAEQEGFRHDFLPMATLSDITRSIDAGFPVLVYVPRHVFAIVGYDEGLETFVTYDVATNDVWVEYLQKDFIKAWKKEATTLVLAYPPEKETLLPEDIRARLTRLSANHLHFQLHFLDAPTGDISIPHLLRAAGDTGEFFFPVTILYADYPGLRASLNEHYAPDAISQAITAYFGEDFDEGVHLWGQYHDERWSSPDWALRYGVDYLIGQQQFAKILALLNTINETGQLSENMLAEAGMIDLAHGNFAAGLDRLINSDNRDHSLYVALAYRRAGNEQEALRALVKTANDSYWGSGLDDYGFPALALAHRLLTSAAEYGESKEALQTHWEEWVQYAPFDAPVVAALMKLYEQQLARLNQVKEPAAHQRLERKIALSRARVARYNLETFGQ